MFSAFKKCYADGDSRENRTPASDQPNTAIPTPTPDPPSAISPTFSKLQFFEYVASYNYNIIMTLVLSIATAFIIYTLVKFFAHAQLSHHNNKGKAIIS